MSQCRNERLRQIVLLASSFKKFSPRKGRKLGTQSEVRPCHVLMQVLFHPTAGHGGFILDTQWRQQILAQVESVIAAGAEAACK